MHRCLRCPKPDPVNASSEATWNQLDSNHEKTENKGGSAILPKATK